MMVIFGDTSLFVQSQSHAAWVCPVDSSYGVDLSGIFSMLHISSSGAGPCKHHLLITA